MALCDVEDPTFSRQLANIWQPYAPATIYPPGRFWYLVPQGHSATERIRAIEKSNYLTGNPNDYFPASSRVPQPIMVLCAPHNANSK
jgi:hypothetical protein